MKRPDKLYDILQPPLPLPPEMSRQKTFNLLCSVRPQNAPEQEMRNYIEADFNRFLYTYGLVGAAATGTCLELGANPYFMTMLLENFTKLNLTLAN